MNRYHDAMQKCVPPEGMEERLWEALSQTEEGARRDSCKRRQGEKRFFGFRRRAVVICALVALIFTTGATVAWDPLFIRRFGPGAALCAMGGATFQEVNVTSVCDDVSLTVRQALCSDKSIYFILDYKLPDDFDAEFFAGIPEGTECIGIPDIVYYTTGELSWEEYRDRDQKKWELLDWSDYTSYIQYLQGEDNALGEQNQIVRGGRGSSSGGGSTQGYDPQTNTMTYFFNLTIDSETDLTAQPLTILVSPLPLWREGKPETAVTDHPAMVTFQPSYDGPQALDGSMEDGDVSLRAVVSPFALTLEVSGMGYQSFEALVADTSLVFRDGSVHPAMLYGFSNGGGASSVAGSEEWESLNTTVHLFRLLDTAEVIAVRIGGYTVQVD